MKLEGRVAFITGSSRGVGHAVALGLAREGCHVVCAGRSVRSTPEAPGSIHKTAEAVRQLGRRALPARIEPRDAAMIQTAVAEAKEQFGQIDFFVHSAGGLCWRGLADTPVEAYDELMAANARGAFACIQAVLPHMIGARYGHILTFAPPLTARGVGGKIAYAAAKLATTVITLGAAEEGFAHNVAANTLWPATLIETPELAREGLGGPEAWRKPAILVDAAIAILSRAPGDYTGQSLIDEDVLRERGVTDFRRYRCAPDHEPPRVGFDYIRHG